MKTVAGKCRHEEVVCGDAGGIKIRRCTRCPAMTSSFGPDEYPDPLPDWYFVTDDDELPTRPAPLSGYDGGLRID